jgi:hypothetical protein
MAQLSHPSFFGTKCLCAEAAHETRDRALYLNGTVSLFTIRVVVDDDAKGREQRCGGASPRALADTAAAAAARVASRSILRTSRNETH